MLRVFKMSGEELVSTSVGELASVMTLKELLRSRYGFPICLQQLLQDSSCLDNSAKLDAPTDLQLVLLNARSVQTRDVAEELLGYAARHPVFQMSIPKRSLDTPRKPSRHQ